MDTTPSCSGRRAKPIGDVFFALAACELNHRHHVVESSSSLIGEGGDGLDEAIVEWAKCDR